MIIISIIENKRGVQPKGLIVEKSMFRMSPSFAVGAMLVCGILVALYTIYW
jgi:SSS family solute:Na+ symporter